jgi:hypothetical protein
MLAGKLPATLIGVSLAEIAEISATQLGQPLRTGPIDTQNVTQKSPKARNYCLLHISAGKARLNR